MKNYVFGTMQKGEKNLITDVPGVRAGHCTLADGDVQTGVTVILPHGGDLYHEKCPAASHVVNGYGKSTGLMQINELGSIETPIILTNTFGVGTAFTACVQYMAERNDGIGRDEGTVNPVVLECNDSFLNDIRGLHVKPEHVFRAIDAAAREFQLGAVGAGRGMTCYGLKGGIGSASRVFEADGQVYTLGALVLTNFGALPDLVICGDPVGRKLTGDNAAEPKGSCIMVIATDAPVSTRQLQRIARRAQSGLARTGGITGGGSGEVVVAFSTANRMISYEPVWHPVVLNDALLDPLFRAATETVEEGIIRSMLEAERVTGLNGNTRESLRDLIDF
ncbi:MAG: P1 family peptidase [Clostridia bacterium]|nr:P1 family peptidase [Clostridia bacterium]